jgi:fermentation-respiration switch protein FrsA (DUF1100 family)
LLALLILVLAWFGQRHLIYLPFGRVPSPGDVGLVGAEEVTFPTEDGLTLRGWFVPAKSTSGFTVIVLPGNAGHRGLRAPIAQALADRGLATFLFDYRGYGGNPGAPSETGLTRDARAARAYVAGRSDVDSSRVAYLGESLGAAVAVRLATEHPPVALILRSPFTSLEDVARYHYPYLPVRWLLRDRYPSIDLIPRVACPVLVIAGDADHTVPASQSARLFAAAAQPKRLVTIEGADHNDYELLAGGRSIGEVVGFVTSVVRRSR